MKPRSVYAIAGGSALTGLLGLAGLPLLVMMIFAGGEDATDCPEPPDWPTAPPAAASSGPPSGAAAAAGDTFETLSDEQLANAKLVVEEGVEIGVPEFGRVVAIATAMQESRLQNLKAGDRDSLGLFQQRPSTGWGTPDQIRDPTFATRAFYGGTTSPHWRAPTNRAEPPGLLDITGYESMTVAQAAQAVQRSAFPSAYAQWEHLARQVVGSFGGGSGGSGPDQCGPGDAMTCPATEFPAEEGLSQDALRVLRCLHENFPEIRDFLGRGSRTDNPDSDHPDGLAVDAIMPPGGPVVSPRALGDRASAWLVENAAALGVRYVIWNAQIWSVDRSDEGWRPYEHPSGRDDDTSLHRDHIHVSVFGDSAGNGTGDWTVPVQGSYEISAGFGQCGRLWGSCHTGVDLASTAVRPILAAAAGDVVVMKDLEGNSYGRYLVIEHPDATETWYGHLEAYAPSLSPGDTVTAGQLIGYMGATGNATGRHLHFEVRPGGGAPTDPVAWMTQHGAPL